MTENADQISIVLSAVAVLLAMLTLIGDFTAYSLEWPTVFQRLVGIILFAVGLSVVIVAVSWLVSSGYEPLSTQDSLVLGAAVSGGIVAVLGLYRIVRPPASAELKNLRRVANAALTHLDGLGLEETLNCP